MENERWIVVTTIQAPTRAIELISSLCERGWSAVVIGDTKTPSDWNSPNITYLSVDEQIKMFGEFASIIPVRHYSRKNLGYLYAIRHGAKLILETDDDNLPGPDFGHSLQQQVYGEAVSHVGWVNVYRYFSEALIWPRGLPLEAIHSVVPLGAAASFDCPVQQYLADDDPDVDAIYRMLYKAPLQFEKREPVVLQPGAWCPFNSQNTAFFEDAFSLLYLPCHVSFRMTDIWRSFVAQAALWAHGYTLSFHKATVKQVRNDHSLLRDFIDEIPGYTGNDGIVKLLNEEYAKGPESTIHATAHRMWKSLALANVIPGEELPIVDAWFNAFQEIAR
jgi:STELLO glycosyltransferase-like protein